MLSLLISPFVSKENLLSLSQTFRGGNSLYSFLPFVYYIYKVLYCIVCMFADNDNDYYCCIFSFSLFYYLLAYVFALL